MENTIKWPALLRAGLLGEIVTVDSWLFIAQGPTKAPVTMEVQDFVDWLVDPRIEDLGGENSERGLQIRILLGSFFLLLVQPFEAKKKIIARRVMSLRHGEDPARVTLSRTPPPPRPRSPLRLSPPFSFSFAHLLHLFSEDTR